MYYGWVHNSYGAARQAAHAATDAESSARRAENAMARLEDAIERQTLIIRSLLEVCSRKGVFTEDEFREIVTEVDLSDGRLDGKYKPQLGPQQCANCGKTNGKRAVTCMYCGNPLDGRELV
ncbi:MAG: zinc ribbon domain-containing protein [Planctomycetes bacterium]|nr:zinc ribbon domain-containing protein [Planctomycetota bacterium]